MANTVKSFVILRNDPASRWAASSVVLHKGEIALSLDNGVYSIKVGDGVNTWSNLPFVTANSKDISSWAKSDTKPSYSANEISGLTDFINSTVTNTNTVYKIVELEKQTGDTFTKYQLYKHDISDADDSWTAVDGSVVTINDFDSQAIENSITALESRVDTIEDDLDSIDEDIAANTQAIATAVSTAATNLETAKTELKAYTDTEVGKLSGALNFRGIVSKTSDITDPADGDVIIVGNKEYIYAGEEWNELGDSSDIATKTYVDGLIEGVTNTIQTVIGTIDDADDGVAVGDICICKAIIDGTTSEYTISTYFWTGSAWEAATGSYNAETVYFNKDLVTTFAIGNVTLTNGQATIPAKGKNLKEVFDYIFKKEDNVDLKKKDPSVSSTAALTWYEQGHDVDSKNVTIVFEDGEYKYGPEPTGSTVEAYIFKFNGGNAEESDSATKLITSAALVGNAKQSVVISARYGVGNTPVSNTGKQYSDQAISGGTTTAVTKELFGSYIPMYLGFKYADGEGGEALINTSNISDTDITGMTKIKDLAAYNKTYTTTKTATESWRQFVYAIPAVTGYKALTAVTDSNGLPLTVTNIGTKTISFGNGVETTYNIYGVLLDADYDTLKIDFTFA